MTKRDFFRTVLKLFGLYSVILTVFNFIPANIAYVTYRFEPVAILWITAAMILAVGLYVFLIRKTDKIINWLKVDTGFDDDRIEIGNFNAMGIVKFALILIGGFLVIDYLPSFLHYSYLAFKKEVSPNGLNMLESLGNDGQVLYFEWTIAIMNLVLGIVLLTNYKRIANWIEKRNNVGQHGE
ncbi:MAG: hypothetical protein HRT65_13970 [Flavobacteriaceae bacterium]|nr:hypothetical protein [Flavobacteriaceae bacterium]